MEEALCDPTEAVQEPVTLAGGRRQAVFYFITWLTQNNYVKKSIIWCCIRNYIFASPLI
jgi:hypothetical protein